MKTFIILCFAILCFGLTDLQAQSIFDKVDQALNKVDKASNAADKTKGTSDKLLGFFKKKDGGDTEAMTTINITGINLVTLKKLNETIQACKDVEDTKMKYSPSGSTIMVAYDGSAEDLLTAIQASSKDIFTDEHIEGLDEHSISINLTKK